ncbi:phage holin family protein [Chitinimonas arctica]|uniref:Phage holin family protein n=1 Tax=Chitinimonas arctica TaxID=2594795 RepID=A0A516SLW2_9NEIS|nr:phage holin family protein [Chitinimonas arctica]QDQ27713.1 phage holin family protein [Chitinimonas arctica]QDQ29129.1 phage holin family protein [Chitinimonas arctica]
MNRLVLLNALVCALMACRLLVFQRGSATHHPRAAWLAYVLAVAAASVPIRLLCGQPVPVDGASLALHTVLAAALFATRGNLAQLFRTDAARPEHPLSRLLRKTP